MAYILEVGERPDGHGIRPRIVEVRTIPRLMIEVAKDKPNLSQLAIRGNYRAVAAHDMARAYSRNIAQQQLSVSDFAIIAPQKNNSLESKTEDPPVYSEGRQGSEMSSSETEFQRLKPSGLGY